MEQQQNYDVNHMELSNNDIDNSFDPILYDYHTDFLMPTLPTMWETLNATAQTYWNAFTPWGIANTKEKYIFPDFEKALALQNDYLTSLFNKDSLKPVVEEPEYVTVTQPVIPGIKSVENVMTFDGGNVTVTQEPIVAQQEQPKRSFSFGNGGANSVNNNINLMNHNMMVQNMHQQQMYNRYCAQQPSYDMNALDLTGGDIVDPFSFYR